MANIDYIQFSVRLPSRPNEEMHEEEELTRVLTLAAPTIINALLAAGYTLCSAEPDDDDGEEATYLISYTKDEE